MFTYIIALLLLNVVFAYSLLPAQKYLSIKSNRKYEMNRNRNAYCRNRLMVRISYFQNSDNSFEDNDTADNSIDGSDNSKNCSIDNNIKDEDMDINLIQETILDQSVAKAVKQLLEVKDRKPQPSKVEVFNNIYKVYLKSSNK